MDFTHKGRILAHRYRHVTYAQAFSGALFWGSFVYFMKRYYSKNRNIPLLLAFTGVSYFAAGEWGKLLFLPALQEAVMMNNMNEEAHQRKITA